MLELRRQTGGRPALLPELRHRGRLGAADRQAGAGTARVAGPAGPAGVARRSDGRGAATGRQEAVVAAGRSRRCGAGGLPGAGDPVRSARLAGRADARRSVDRARRAGPDHRRATVRDLGGGARRRRDRRRIRLAVGAGRAATRATLGIRATPATRGIRQHGEHGQRRRGTPATPARRRPRPRPARRARLRSRSSCPRSSTCG